LSEWGTLVKLLEKDGFKILRVKKWHTFDYQEAKYGTAEVKKKPRSGLYLMERVNGYDLCFIEKPLLMTHLYVDGRPVMVDYPLTYYGMKLLAEASEGHVLTAGLGLGLYTIFLQQNPKVESVTVVEINSDIKHLISPMISKYIVKPTEIIVGDIFDYVDEAGNYDTIMLDIWTPRKSDGDPYDEMMNAYAIFRGANPNAKIYVWGMRNPRLNPAVGELDSKYMKLLKNVSITPMEDD